MASQEVSSKAVLAGKWKKEEQELGAPLLFGSLWALIPGGSVVLLMVARTALEDTTLVEEFDGYQDYARRVPFRLVPGIG